MAELTLLTTVACLFKKDLNLQIHLHKICFSSSLFLDFLYKSFLNQFKGFLNRGFSVLNLGFNERPNKCKQSSKEHLDFCNSVKETKSVLHFFFLQNTIAKQYYFSQKYTSKYKLLRQLQCSAIKIKYFHIICPLYQIHVTAELAVEFEKKSFDPLKVS